MFENSKDILYLVLAFCVLWVTGFMCWMFYYLARLLRNTSQIVEEFRTRLQGLTDTVTYIRRKVEQISGLLSMAGHGAAGYVKNFVKNKARHWAHQGAKNFDHAAKEAVDKAVEATAKGMHKAADAFRK
ncbi:hypothetical protein EPN28_02085 [Patescibacteria group bacterium]|nr:MAG: hypothetical protein EPN28_02085 [Patescibacteria group bacterium]